jgi:hypothetical protein
MTRLLRLVNRLPVLAADLVDRKVAVVAATGGGRSVLGAKASNAMTPLVFSGDPVQERGSLSASTVKAAPSCPEFWKDKS